MNADAYVAATGAQFLDICRREVYDGCGPLMPVSGPLTNRGGTVNALLFNGFIGRQGIPGDRAYRAHGHITHGNTATLMPVMLKRQKDLQPAFALYAFAL